MNNELNFSVCECYLETLYKFHEITNRIKIQNQIRGRKTAPKRLMVNSIRHASLDVLNLHINLCEFTCLTMFEKHRSHIRYLVSVVIASR